MNILLIDNYDSFTYNLAYAIRQTPHYLAVCYNNRLTVEEVAAYDAILISPGPGLPREAGIVPEVIAAYAHSKPMLGVCLGHQAIAECFGAVLHNLQHVQHGVASTTRVCYPDYLFDTLPQEFTAGRYHSWAVESNTLPECFRITAVDDNGAIMALAHKYYNLRGVQFHPESVLTEHGVAILRNWLEYNHNFLYNKIKEKRS